MELELSFTHSPVSEVTVRRFGAKVFCWLSTPPNTDTVDDGCVAFYEFWERENSLEKRVRCGKARNVSVVCRVTPSVHTASYPSAPLFRLPTPYLLL